MIVAAPGGWRLDRRWRATIALALAACFLLSLMLPVATTDRGTVADGLLILLIGWFGLFGLQLAWIANLLLPWALPLIAADAPQRKRLRVLGGVLLACVASTSLWSSIPDDAGSHPIVARHAGYYLWLAAVAGTGLAAIILPARETDPR